MTNKVVKIEPYKNGFRLINQAGNEIWLSQEYFGMLWDHGMFNKMDDPPVW
jgi:hypothetical protein